MDLLTASQVQELRTVFSVFATPLAAFVAEAHGGHGGHGSNNNGGAAPSAEASAASLVMGVPQLASVLHALGLETTDSEVIELLSRADTAGRGHLDFADFCLVMAGELRDTVIDADLADAFAAMDRGGDKNGTLQAEEVEREILTVRPVGAGAASEAPLTRADVDGLIAEAAGKGATGLTLPVFTALMKASL